MAAKPEDYRNQFKNLFKSLLKNGRYDSFEVFKDALEIMAIVQRQSIFNQFKGHLEKDEKYHELESRYMDFFVPKYGREGLTIISKMMAVCQMALAEEIQDFLGNIYEEMDLVGNLDRQRRGEFFTPQAVSRFLSMIQITETDLSQCIQEKGYLSVEDPCCGFGSMLIEAVRQADFLGFQPHRSLLLSATDIAPHCFHATYLQLSLLQVPAIVRLGNTLSSEYSQCWLTPPLMMASIKGVLGTVFRGGTGMFAYRPDAPIDVNVREAIERAKSSLEEGMGQEASEDSQLNLFDQPQQEGGNDDDVESSTTTSPPPEKEEVSKPQQLSLFDDF